MTILNIWGGVNPLSLHDNILETDMCDDTKFIAESPIHGVWFEWNDLGYAINHFFFHRPPEPAKGFFEKVIYRVTRDDNSDMHPAATLQWVQGTEDDPLAWGSPKVMVGGTDIVDIIREVVSTH